MPGTLLRTSRLAVFASLLMTAYSGAALAQTGTGNGAEPNSGTPEKHASPSPTSPSVTGSTKNGVIKPKGDVDPNMTKIPPAKGTGNMPVIKPKGTPGGPPGPKPK